MAIKETYRNTIAVSAADAVKWRKWLEKNHAVQKSVWLIIFKKACGTPSVTYDEAVNEALCFGWIDSLANKRDADSFYQYFTTRKPKSKWSAVNKKKIDMLLQQQKMHPAGMAMVELAKQTGTWDALNDIENLVVPPDLNKALSKNKIALHHWESFPRSSKRAILEWIGSAKQQTTRDKRVMETVSLAAKNIRAR